MLKTVSSVANALGALNYKGTWDAATNTPTLASGVGTQGDYYVVSVAGTTDLDGITNWGVGDWAAFNGSVWQRVEGGADGNFVNLEVTGDASIDDILLIGQDSGDAFNPDAILRLQRTGDRVFQQFKSDTDEVCAILFGDTSDDVRGQIEWDNSTDSLAFYTNDNDLAATFTSSGNLAFPSGKGIDFSATAGAGTSELFDDYEEGAWTPVVADASSGGNLASATVDGDYVKIGNSVTVSCAINNIDTTGLTSGNDVYIRGFPFVAKDMSTLGNNNGAIALSDITFSGYATLSLRDAQQYARISESSSGALNDFIVVSELGSSADIYFSHTYITE